MNKEYGLSERQIQVYREDKQRVNYEFGEMMYAKNGRSYFNKYVYDI